MIRSNHDFPQIIINSIPAPEIIHGAISDEDLAPYTAGLKELDTFGVDFIVMVCNTIHLFHSRMQTEVGAKIIDLRQEIGLFLDRKRIRSAFIMGTPCTISGGLYRFSGLQLFEPSAEEVVVLAHIIHEFNCGINRRSCQKIARGICKRYLSLGAESVVLGCTEFAVMLGNDDIPKINTIDVLVDAVINKFRENPFKEPNSGKYVWQHKKSLPGKSREK